MKIKHILVLSVLIISITSCLGDKKLTDVSEIGDTSFVNKNFNGNNINYVKGMSACDKISAEAIAELYNVSTDKVHIEDPTKSDRYKKDMEPICSFFIEDGDSDFMWLRGSMALKREVGKDEFMGDIAEAAGGGENWEEAWSMKKATSKSSEWIPNIGQAALWNDSKKELLIKFDGYTLHVYPIKNGMNKNEVAKNRDYKKAAIAIAKSAGYIN